MSYQLFNPTDCFDYVIQALEQEDQNRREIAFLGSQAIKLAKKAIFAIQRRGDAAQARLHLKETRIALADLQNRFPDAGGRWSGGQWQVAREEYLEALFFLLFWEGKAISTCDISDVADPEETDLIFAPEDIFGALSDLTGEISRQCQLWIIDGKYDEAMRAAGAVGEAVELLNQNNSSGEIRKKVEQATRNLHNVDSRITDMKLRGLI